VDKSKRAVILGGGLTGLVTADKLQSAGYDVTIVEKTNKVGGMCRSEMRTHGTDRVLYDFGPHKFAPADQRAMDYFMGYVSNPINVDITGAVIIRGKKFDYPVKVTEILKNFPVDGIRCGIDFFLKIFASEDGTYAGYLTKKMGRHTYDFVFRDYAKKIWGDPKGLDRELARTRVVTPGLLDVIKNMISGENTLTFKSFVYPNLCMGVFLKFIEMKILDGGGRIWTNSEPLSYNGRKLVISKEGRAVSFDNPLVISTIKPRDMAKVMSLGSRPLSKLRYRGINLYYFLVEGVRPINTWLFFPEKSVIFNRTSINFHPAAAGKGKFLLCAEVTGKLDNAPLAILSVKKQVCDIYGLHRDDVVASWHEYLEDAYPIYHVGFKDDIKHVLRMIESHGNVFCIGRHACHNYNNMDHTIVEACDLVDIVDSGGKIHDWQKKRDSYDWRIVD